MVDSIGIYKRANSIVQTYGTRDTLKIAKAIGIDVVPVSCFETFSNVRLQMETPSHVLQ